MQILPNGKTQFIDQNGLPLASGTVGYYFPGTLNPKATFQDAAGSIANTNPVTLDSRGQAIVWGSGVYRQIVKDASGITIWDQVTEDSNAGLTGNITNARWIAGGSYTDPVGSTPGTFVPGTTTTFNLPVAPGSISNISTFFDTSFQQDDQISSLTGTALVFTSAVPNGIQAVEIKIGTTVAIGTPNPGTVTGASLNVAGAGALTPTISFAYNPSGITNWTTGSGNSPAGINVDIGGFGPYTDQGLPIVSSLSGSVNVPALATIPAHAAAVTGYAKSASTATAAVAFYGEARRQAVGAGLWGINTICTDNGLGGGGVNGAEFDFNLTSTSTLCIGVSVTGGSTVSPALGIGFNVDGIGLNAVPKIPWTIGYRSNDGGAQIAFEVGATGSVANSPSQPINFWFYNASAVRTQCGQIGSDASGNFSIENPDTSALMVIQSGTNKNISMVGGGIGFYGASPILQPGPIGFITGFVGNAGTQMTNQSTSTGGVGSAAYTFGDVVRALKLLNLMSN